MPGAGRGSDRNAQFGTIAWLKAEHRATGLPVLSIGTKKKELLGDFYRGGMINTQEAITASGHDLPSWGGGKVIPHGLYDVGGNEGFVHLNATTTPARWRATALRHVGSNTVGRSTPVRQSCCSPCHRTAATTARSTTRSNIACSRT